MSRRVNDLNSTQGSLGSVPSVVDQMQLEAELPIMPAPAQSLDVIGDQDVVEP
jgi:hypothetical protein